jgi:hypothetical protein
VRTIRFSREGFATSHYSVAHARLTGNPFEHGAPVGLILGDSHVEASNVPDSETMGAVVERVARASGVYLNVRQYGISGAGPANYVAQADTLKRVWHPAWVAVIVTDDDFEPASLSRPPRLEELPGGRYRLVPDSTPFGRAPLERLLVAVATRSRLGYRIGERVARLREGMSRADPAPTQSPAKPSGAVDGLSDARLAVRALRDAYGQLLRVVYVPVIGIERRQDRDRYERAVRDACLEAGVSFVSTGPQMITAIEKQHVLSRGFSNSAPGVGHLNSTGHRIVAMAILDLTGVRP